ncbi:MAG: UDP-4-amino-4,6-dideoxy-N-acetyl-beta-L-altrosamine transaminase [Patescibacteria group bacterium]
MIPYGKQEITSQDISAVVKVLKSDFLTQGPQIAEFEKEFAKYVGAKYAVAVANGTAALHISALALGVSKKSHAITTPITFVASGNCVLYAGGQVEFADINSETLILDVKKIKQLLESKPKNYYSGLIVVDMAGYPADLKAFRKLADKHGLWIIEDACHALGCGNGKFADVSTFSFHPVKHITTGEGGMITTNRQDLYEKLLRLRTHGITKDPRRLKERHGGWYYEMQDLGFNYRMTDIQATLGRSQLKRARKNLAKRRKIARVYDQAFKNTSIQISPKCLGHAYHLYIIQTKKRKELYDYLHDNGILVQVHYIPMHLHPFYKKMGWKKGNFPKAEAYYEKALSLPMYPTLTNKEQKFVIKKVLEFIK